MHGNLGAGPSAPVDGGVRGRSNGLRPAAAVGSASPAASVDDRIRSATGSARAGRRTIVRNVRGLDFRREVWLVDERTIAVVSGQPALWAVVLLASLPLLFVTRHHGGQPIVG